MKTVSVQMQKMMRQRGFVMILAALLIAGLLGIATVIVQRTQYRSDQASRSYHETRVFYAADGRSDVAQDWLRHLLENDVYPSQSTLNTFVAPTIPEFSFPELRIIKMPQLPAGTIPTGPYAGMKADIQPYDIISRATNANSTVDKSVKVTVQQQAIEGFQFGIFFDQDLEMFPAYPLDYHGSIHTNGNLYLGSSDVLNIDATVTAGGHIYNIPKDPTLYYNGKARITDPAGHWHDLSYDSRDPNWRTKSLNDWQGRVLDSSLSVVQMGLPLPTPANPIEIIRRGQMSDDEELIAKRYYYKAGLLILDGNARDSSGSPVMLTAGVITTSSVYDYREGHDMEMKNLNIGLLMSSGLMPANRVIYVSYLGATDALRLVNGATLPSGGLTVATDMPCYIRSNYNTVNKKAASVLCDAFNVYSTWWSDSNDTQNLNQRLAGATTVNTCVVAGNEPTTPGSYSGGAENLIRLHEKWVGHELTYRGSLICIWNSQRATGHFINASYIEAHRDWAFDPVVLDPDQWPPGQMALRFISRTSWTSQ